MKRLLFAFILFSIIPVVEARSAHAPEHIEGDEIDYKYSKDKGDFTYNFPESYINDTSTNFHLYGYISSEYTHEQNPYYYSEETMDVLNIDPKDNYSAHKLYLVNAIEFSDYTVWNTIFDGTARFYETYNTLNDSYFRIRTGPSFLLPNNKTKITTKIMYSGEESYYRKTFGSIGAIFKINHAFFDNFNTTFDYEIEKRDYNPGNTDETDRYVYSTFLTNRLYLYKMHLFKLTPLHKYYKTKSIYQDKNIYGLATSYVFSPKNIKFYFGLGYEYLLTAFKTPEIGETYKKEITETEYSVFIGYNFFENLAAEASYGYKKIDVNQPNTSASYDNTISLSLVYKFHIL